MSLVDGRGLIRWEGALFDPADRESAALLARLKWAIPEIRRRGGKVTVTEAGRPVGVSSDRFARNAWDTASGISTMWFQWGRYLRGETPSAINPAEALSTHTLGSGVDLSSPTARDVRIRNEVLAMVGIIQTIPQVESWHYELRDFGVGGGYFASHTTTPVEPEKPRPIPFYERPYGRVTKEKTVIAHMLIDGLGKLGPKGATRTYTIGAGWFEDTTGQPTANEVSVLLNGYDANGVVRNSPNLTYAELYSKAKASGALSPAELKVFADAAGVKVS